MRTTISVTNINYNLGLIEYMTFEVVQGTCSVIFHWYKAYHTAKVFMLTIERKDSKGSISVTIPAKQVPEFDDCDFYDRTLIKWMYDNIENFSYLVS